VSRSIFAGSVCALLLYWMLSLARCGPSMAKKRSKKASSESYVTFSTAAATCFA